MHLYILPHKGHFFQRKNTTVNIVHNNNNNNNIYNNNIVICMTHNRPDISLVLPNDKKAFLVDIAIPGDSRLSSKVLGKQTHYTNLKIEVEKLWSVKCVIVPIIFGALGSIPINLTKCLVYKLI